HTRRLQTSVTCCSRVVLEKQNGSKRPKHSRPWAWRKAGFRSLTAPLITTDPTSQIQRDPSRILGISRISLACSLFSVLCVGGVSTSTHCATSASLRPCGRDVQIGSTAEAQRRRGCAVSRVERNSFCCGVLQTQSATNKEQKLKALKLSSYASYLTLGLPAG